MPVIEAKQTAETFAVAFMGAQRSVFWHRRVTGNQWKNYRNNSHPPLGASTADEARKTVADFICDHNILLSRLAQISCSWPTSFSGGVTQPIAL